MVLTIMAWLLDNPTPGNRDALPWNISHNLAVYVNGNVDVALLSIWKGTHLNRTTVFVVTTGSTGTILVVLPVHIMC